VDAGFAELIYSPGGPAGRWHFTALGNLIDANRPVVSLRLGEQNQAPGYLREYTTAGASMHYLLRRNVRLLGETNWDFKRDQARLITGFSVGF
jgi:hypothetical protein